MADTTTELEVLNQIVDVLGGQSGQYETVVPTLQQILALLGGGGGGSGYNPALSVGRADALTGADSTAQWATRESTGSGAATVRSVQGAAEVQDGELVPVRIAGIASTDAQGGELDSVEWTAQTLRAAGSIADVLYSDHVDVRVGVVDLGTFEWSWQASWAAWYTAFIDINAAVPPINVAANVSHATLQGITQSNATWSGYTGTGIAFSANTADPTKYRIIVKDGSDSVQPSGIMYYELATPTTQPISPALDMTYRVQTGGSESIIVPDGEISAAPVLTVAEGESAGELVMDALACIAAPDGPVATANHSVGTYLTMQGKLYKVTSAIAVGESIVAGTNVTATTVMDEILALN